MVLLTGWISASDQCAEQFRSLHTVLGQSRLPKITVTSPRDHPAGATRVPRRSKFLLGSPGPHGPNGAAYAASGPLWCRLESSLAYLSCFATHALAGYSPFFRGGRLPRRELP